MTTLTTMASDLAKTVSNNYHFLSLSWLFSGYCAQTQLYV